MLLLSWSKPRELGPLEVLCTDLVKELGLTISIWLLALIVIYYDSSDDCSV